MGTNLLPQSSKPSSSSSLDKESIIIIALTSLMGLGFYICKVVFFPSQKETVWTTKLGEKTFRSDCKRFEIKMLNGHSSRECQVSDLKNPGMKPKIFNNLKECKEWVETVKK